jgi:hypothetical protein
LAVVAIERRKGFTRTDSIITLSEKNT